MSPGPGSHRVEIQTVWMLHAVVFVSGFKDFKLGPLFWDAREFVPAPPEARGSRWLLPLPARAYSLRGWSEGAHLSGPSS